MSSPKQDNETVSSSADAVSNGGSGSGGSDGASVKKEVRPPAKRPAPAVIEISDTDSDDSDICAVTSYQASADEVKRIRGDADDDYSSSSSSDYSSDSESPWEDDSVIIKEEKDRGKAIQKQLNPRANRTDDPQFNPKIKSQQLIDDVTTYWRDLKDHKTPEVTLTTSPFRLCLLHNFLDNPEIINNIVDDMNTLDWSRKKMDLYEFHQTADLASLTWQRSIRGIYELLKTEVMSWVSQVTGLTLTSVSASCSLYGPGDHLLVHDDLLRDRRVAFILYLAPWGRAAGGMRNGGGDVDTIILEEEITGWSRSMGGALQLIARDEAGAGAEAEEGAEAGAGAVAGAGRVAHSVSPCNNMLAFFQVGTDSFHQVEEVLSLELPRLSINGWFHGPGAPTGDAGDAGDAGAGDAGDADDTEVTVPMPVIIKPHQDVVLLNEWIEVSYMSPRNRCQIQEQMESDSEVCLRDFFTGDKYREVVEALESPETKWEWCGPSNQRHYERLSGGGAGGGGGACAAGGGVAGGSACDALLRLVSSAAFCRMLADCTDLVLTGYQRLELQRWTPGDYTLLPPRELYQDARLEMVMYLKVPERPICGGSTTYVAPEEPPAPAPAPAAAHVGAQQLPAALVTLPPVSNALNLVYCDAGAAGFTKYLSRMTLSDDDHFYILTCTFKE